MADSTISFIVLGAAVALFVSNRVAPEIVAVGAALALYATGVLDAEQAIAGFGDPTVVFIAALFVVSEALDATGVTAWVGRWMIARAGPDPKRLLILLMMTVALVAAVVTPNGAVAALLPIGVVIALRLGRAPSTLLMPLAFVASAGAQLALTGSPVNVIVADAASDATGQRFGYLEFALAGLPLVAGTIAIGTLLGPRLLPQRTPRTMPRDLSLHTRTLVDHYALEQGELFTREAGVAEAIIPPRSPLIGSDVFPGMVTNSGDLMVLAVHRRGAELEGDTVLASGDTLLLRGTWRALDDNLDDSEVLVVDPVDHVRRQTVPMGGGAKRALAVLAGMVILLATGAVPAFVASLLAAGAIVLLGVLSVDEAYRAVSWTTVVLIGGMIAVSTAIMESGAAEKIAHVLVETVGDLGPHALLIGLFVLTVVFGQLISNTATALIVVPIALSAAAELDVSPRPVLMSVAVAAAASFLTPVATPANLMVMGPGGYRFGDYWRLGACLIVLFFVVAVLLVPVVWSFG
ncbi:MAG TPA: SLC13 family permease [Solirubrobacter sp.]|nr:SLC13 family permease [Solirubrobacter sp.]